jgi:hypothetical protein
MSTEEMRLSEIIDAFVINFRNRDLKACRSSLAGDFQWFNSDGTLVLEGATTFLTAIEDFWRDNPKVQNVCSPCIQIGNLVAHTETFTGFADGRTEENIWVYEFQGEQIRKMFGYLVKK